jgi:hypothetical protein
VLETAGILCLLVGVAHSYLGERYILIRLFQNGRVPHLFGSDFFPKGTLRFAWHITTFAWWGFGYLLFKIEAGEESLAQVVLYTIGTVFLFSGVFSFGFTKGKHLSWLLFWIIAGVSYYAASSGQ